MKVYSYSLYIPNFQSSLPLPSKKSQQRSFQRFLGLGGGLVGWEIGFEPVNPTNNWRFVGKKWWSWVSLVISNDFKWKWFFHSFWVGSNLVSKWTSPTLDWNSRDLKDTFNFKHFWNKTPTCTMHHMALVDWNSHWFPGVQSSSWLRLHWKPEMDPLNQIGGYLHDLGEISVTSWTPKKYRSLLNCSFKKWDSNHLGRIALRQRYFSFRWFPYMFNTCFLEMLHVKRFFGCFFRSKKPGSGFWMFVGWKLKVKSVDVFHVSSLVFLHCFPLEMPLR